MAPFRRTWRVLPWLAFLALPAAATAPLERFEATIAPSRPIGFEGSVSSRENTTFVVAIDAGPVSGPLLQNVTRLIVRSNESHWSGPTPHVGPVPAFPNPTSLGRSFNETFYDFRRPQVEFLARTPRPEWAAAALLRPNELHVGGPRCDIDTAKVAPGEFHGQALGAVGSALVRAQCSGSSPRFGNGFSLYAFNVTIHIVDEAVNGTRHTWIETGAYSDKDPRTGFPRKGVRVAQLLAKDFGATASFPVANRTVLYAPVLGLAGALSIPPARGTIRWGDEILVDPQQSTDARGAFAAAGHSDPSPLRLTGVATARPLPGGSILAPPWLLVAAAVGAGAATLGLLLRRFFLWLLFSRLSEAQALQHPRRRLLYDAVAANPGITPHELLAVTGWRRSVATHHIQVLRNLRLLTGVRTRRGLSLFLHGRHSPKEMRFLALMRDPVAREVHQAASRWPEATQRDLARRIGISQATISRRLRRLKAAQGPD